MQHKPKNLFTTDESCIRNFQDTKVEKIVFISYRRTPDDIVMAGRCAEVFKDVGGIHYWLDEDDACMQDADAANDDLKKAHCIEQGLDVSSALLGIIGPETFDSPWIPYEIGGARGRQHYRENSEIPHPFIAHLLHDVEPSEVPAFVGLGTPLLYRNDLCDHLCEVRKWAKSVAEILQGDSVDASHTRHRLRDIYDRNTQSLKLSQV